MPRQQQRLRRSHVRNINNVIRALRAIPVQLTFWQYKGNLRLIGIPDAAYKNNEGKYSKRGLCIFLAEPRQGKETSTRGYLIDFESKQVRATTMRTAVAELYSFMKGFGTCQFLRGQWIDISGQCSEVHMRVRMPTTW